MKSGRVFLFGKKEMKTLYILSFVFASVAVAVAVALYICSYEQFKYAEVEQLIRNEAQCRAWQVEWRESHLDRSVRRYSLIHVVLGRLGWGSGSTEELLDIEYTGFIDGNNAFAVGVIHDNGLAKEVFFYPNSSTIRQRFAGYSNLRDALKKEFPGLKVRSD